MKKWIVQWYIPQLLLVSITFYFIGQLCNIFSIHTFDEDLQQAKHCIVIDAGHGGVDGGATSCTGVLESKINLQIALKLNAIFHLLGYETKMIRTEDVSVYTKGVTIAQKKISDLKERVRIINSTNNAVLLSIHQNYFQDSKYSGAQVFYANTKGSSQLAECLQSGFRYFDAKNNRSHKMASGVYLMNHITSIGVLIECGFLSNSAEEANLREESYQKFISCIIALNTALFLDQQEIY